MNANPEMGFSCYESNEKALYVVSTGVANPSTEVAFDTESKQKR